MTFPFYQNYQNKPGLQSTSILVEELLASSRISTQTLYCVFSVSDDLEVNINLPAIAMKYHPKGLVTPWQKQQEKGRDQAVAKAKGR